MRLISAFALFLVAGCASVPSGYESSLRLSATEFNAIATNWRLLESRKEYVAAARLLEAYIARHAASLAEEDRVLFHFHAAQEYAFAADYRRALRHLPRARYSAERTSFPIRWNDYVSATEAFLLRDRAGLQAARERIAAGPTWNGEVLNLNVVDSLIEHFDEPYLAAYMKATRTPNKAPL
jgi:hypothetical protein